MKSYINVLLTYIIIKLNCETFKGKVQEALYFPEKPERYCQRTNQKISSAA